MGDKANNGWISLYKKFTNWEWYKDINVKVVFIHLLLKASYEDTIWNGIEIKRGQVLTSRKHLSEEIGLPERPTRTALKKLEATNELTIKTTNKYTLITVEKYEFYQNGNLKTTSKATNELPNKTTSKATTSNNIYNNTINNNIILNYTTLNLLFNYLINNVKKFENLNDNDRIAIVNVLKRLEIYVTSLNSIPKNMIDDLKLQYWTIKELYLSPYKLYLDKLTNKKFMFRYLKTKQYMECDSEEKIGDFIAYFIKSLREDLEKTNE